jgi:hypothetical protein
MSKLYPWLSILMALALALFEWAFFFSKARTGKALRDRLRPIG